MQNPSSSNIISTRTNCSHNKDVQQSSEVTKDQKEQFSIKKFTDNIEEKEYYASIAIAFQINLKSNISASSSHRTCVTSLTKKIQEQSSSEPFLSNDKLNNPHREHETSPATKDTESLTNKSTKDTKLNLKIQASKQLTSDKASVSTKNQDNINSHTPIHKEEDPEVSAPGHTSERDCAQDENTTAINKNYILEKNNNKTSSIKIAQNILNAPSRAKESISAISQLSTMLSCESTTHNKERTDDNKKSNRLKERIHANHSPKEITYTSTSYQITVKNTTTPHSQKAPTPSQDETLNNNITAETAVKTYETHQKNIPKKAFKDGETNTNRSRDSQSLRNSSNLQKNKNIVTNTFPHHQNKTQNSYTTQARKNIQIIESHHIFQLSLHPQKTST